MFIKSIIVKKTTRKDKDFKKILDYSPEKVKDECQTDSNLVRNQTKKSNLNFEV